LFLIKKRVPPNGTLFFSEKKPEGSGVSENHLIGQKQRIGLQKSIFLLNS